MANVVLLAGGEEIERFSLQVGRLLIGRTERADIRLSDTTVSGKHAVLEALALDDGRLTFYLQDLGSTNGTLLNGAPVRRKTLNDGDEIDVGRHSLRFQLRD